MKKEEKGNVAGAQIACDTECKPRLFISVLFDGFVRVYPHFSVPLILAFSNKVSGTGGFMPNA